MSTSTRTTEAERGWLAGIIDGEGSINATRAGGRSRHLVTNVQLNIASSDWRVIKQVKDLINRITGESVPAYMNRVKLGVCWVVRVSRKRTLRALLPSLLCHLQLKRAQNALALEMATRSWDNNGIPEWVDQFGHRIQWYNQHRFGPDGKWSLSGYERTRQSRGKQVSRYEPEPVETLQAAVPVTEEKVH